MSTEALSPQPRAQQEALTHAAVMTEYAQNPDANPDLLAHMDRLTATEMTAEQALITDVESREAAEAPRQRGEITAEHHQQHVELAAPMVADVRERPMAEQDLIGEMLELGESALDNISEAESETLHVNDTIAQLKRLTAGVENYASDDFKRENHRANVALHDLKIDTLPRKDVQALLLASAELDLKYNKVNPEAASLTTTATLEVLRELSPTKMRSLYHAQEYRDPDSGESTSLIKDYLEHIPLNHERSLKIARLMTRAYDKAPSVACFKEGDDKVVDRLRNEASFAAIALSTLPERPLGSDKEALDDYEKQVGAVISGMMINVFKLPPQLTNHVGRALNMRLHLEPESRTVGSYYNSASVRRSFNSMARIMEVASPDEMTRLHDELGVVNLDRYTPADTRKLLALLDADPTTVDYLKAGDVNVVLVDSYGDYNGAFDNIVAMSTKQSGRTIPFEIGKPSDFYRRMILLKKLGIKPSVITIAAHGSPGITSFGQGSESFALTTSRNVATIEATTNALPLDEAQLGKIASDKFMQASRGIDDPAEFTGRRSIVFDSCSSDTEYRNMLPSVVETVVRTTNREDVDVYGAANVLYASGGSGAINFNGRKKADITEKLRPNGRKVNLMDQRSYLARIKRLTPKHDLLYNGRNISAEVVNRHLVIKRSSFKTLKVDNRPKGAN